MAERRQLAARRQQSHDDGLRQVVAPFAQLEVEFGARRTAPLRAPLAEPVHRTQFAVPGLNREITQQVRLWG